MSIPYHCKRKEKAEKATEDWWPVNFIYNYQYEAGLGFFVGYIICAAEAQCAAHDISQGYRQKIAGEEIVPGKL